MGTYGNAVSLNAGYPVANANTINTEKTTASIPAASPSSPSLRFTALDAPEITITANGIYTHDSWNDQSMYGRYSLLSIEFGVAAAMTLTASTAAINWINSFIFAVIAFGVCFLTLT